METVKGRAMFARVVDVVIAGACATMAVVMLWERVGPVPGRPGPPSAQMLALGSKMPELPEISWREAKRTLVIVTQSTCPYCERSTAFWKRLVTARDEQRSPLKIVAVSSDNVNTTREYLAVHDVTVDAFASAVLAVRGTPSLLLVDSQGLVLQSWMGMPPSPAAEDEIIRSAL
jgi:hypothetical protein